MDVKGCNFYVNGNIIDYENIKNIKLNKFKLKVSLKENPDIFDEILLKRTNNYYKLKNNNINSLNNIIIEFDVFYSRVINKLKRILKIM